MAPSTSPAPGNGSAAEVLTHSVYVRTSLTRKKVHHSSDPFSDGPAEHLGSVLADYAEDGTLLGIEILGGVRIEVDGIPLKLSALPSTVFSSVRAVQGGELERVCGCGQPLPEYLPDRPLPDVSASRISPKAQLQRSQRQGNCMIYRSPS